MSCSECGQGHGWHLSTCSANDRRDKKAPPATQLDTIENLLEQMQRRMVRIETRATNALRFQGLLIGGAVRDPALGQVLPKDGKLYATGVNVPIALVAEAAVLAGYTGDVPIIVNNCPWGTITIHP